MCEICGWETMLCPEKLTMTTTTVTAVRPAEKYDPSGSFTCYTHDEWANDVMKKVEDFFNMASEEEIINLLIKCGHPNPYERKPKWYDRFKFWGI